MLRGDACGHGCRSSTFDLACHGKRSAGNDHSRTKLFHSSCFSSDEFVKVGAVSVLVHDQFAMSWFLCMLYSSFATKDIG